MSSTPVSTPSPHKMSWWNETLSNYLHSTFLDEPVVRDYRKIGEMQRGREYSYEKHANEEMAKASLESHPEATLLSAGPHYWLVLKDFRHSLGFHQKNQLVDRKHQGASETCFAYASASALEALWRVNLEENTLVEVTELMNCHPNSQDDGGGGFTEDCLHYVMAYGVDTVPIENGILQTDKHHRRRIDGYMKVPQFHLEYLILAVTQQPVLATMKVGEKFSNLRGAHGDDIYEGEAADADLINHAILIEGYYMDESNGNEFFRILNSHGETWGVDGYGKVAIDRKLRQGVGNLYGNAMYPVIYENISVLDLELMKYGNFHCLQRSGLPIPFPDHTRNALKPYFNQVIMESACTGIGGVPQEGTPLTLEYEQKYAKLKGNIGVMTKFICINLFVNFPVQVDCDGSGVQQKGIEIANNNGEKLAGILHETKSERIVILCHDFRSTKENNTMVNLAVALGKQGTTAFRFDFSGNGQSDGCFRYGDYWGQVEDLRAVVKHFNRGGRVTSAILGHGKGGNVALLYASKYHDISTIVNVSGCYDLRRDIGECRGEDFISLIKNVGYFDVKSEAGEVSYRVTLKNLTDVLNTNMREACRKIDKNCRVLTVHGDKDEIIPYGDGLEFAMIISNHEIQFVEGADHGYTSHQAELTSIVLPFVKGV